MNEDRHRKWPGEIGDQRRAEAFQTLREKGARTRAASWSGPVIATWLVDAMEVEDDFRPQQVFPVSTHPIDIGHTRTICASRASQVRHELGEGPPSDN